MYLKSIEVQGFKSFANKINFRFENGITGIVGPNGSGKSNVADAVRWVLGEQRIKQLRGASMQDVIFSGTELRKPMGYAYVSITLDNADHSLPIDFEELQLPFKRFQIQPVWRADRPQKGRYREFYQCDADVVGSDSLLNEVDLIQMTDTVFTRFGVRVAIKMNNRKILAGLAESVGQSDKMTDITVAIDKLDKIGLDNVNAELLEKGLPLEAVNKLQPVIMLSGSNQEKLAVLEKVLADSEIGRKGIEECRFILDKISQVKLSNSLELDLTLARGLNYYTGAIFEVKALDVGIGSISGGGRYDNLTGIFGMPGISGVGISFGADRIYDVLCQLGLYPDAAESATKVLLLNMGEAEAGFCISLLPLLRNVGISAELYPDSCKMKKQMAYANALGVRYVVIVGGDELASGKVMLKDMESGEQKLLSPSELVSTIG